MADDTTSNGIIRVAAPHPWLVHALFFVSGCAALIYEMTWSRLVGLAIGNTAEASTLVLASYFTGLAIGQLLGSRLQSRVQPFKLYGIAEILAAIWVCMIPTLLDWVAAPVEAGSLYAVRSTSFVAYAFCFIILLPATVPLGATLPLIADCFSGTKSAKKNLTFAYGLNTAGGLVGIIVALAFSFVAVGVRGSSYVAALAAAGCGLVALALSPFNSANLSTEAIATENAGSIRWPTSWAIFAGVSGFGVLGLESLYIRLFTLVFHNSSYTFGAVVAVFLLSLSAGAMLASALASRISVNSLVNTSLLLAGLLLLFSLELFPLVTGLNYFESGSNFTSYLLGVVALVTLFVLPPVTLLGVLFPVILHAIDRRRIGSIAALNAIAAVNGAVVVGLILPPLLGVTSTFKLVASMFVVLGVIGFWQSRRTVAAVCAAAVLLALCFRPQGLQSSEDQSEWQVLRRWESAYGWIDAVRNDSTGAMAVRQNLHYRHGSTASSDLLMRLGEIPLLLHAKPSDVAFLGLGTGMTLSPAVVDQAVQRASLVELIPEVVEASRMLTPGKVPAVDSPKVTVKINDARQFLLHSDKRFDVIVADLFVPWESRTGYLYTAEFYKSVRSRLKPDGHFCQWIALYQVGREDFELIANSFASVFPNTSLWWGDLDASRPMLALIGREHELQVGGDGIANRMKEYGKSSSLIESGIREPEDLLGLYLGDWTFVASSRINTDEHPWLEFMAPISHRSSRTLRGTELRRLFDGVLVRLPTENVRMGDDLNTNVRELNTRRARQRFSMFGDEAATPDSRPKTEFRTY